MLRHFAFPAALVLALSSCQEPTIATGRDATTPVDPAASADRDPTFVGAGDIATCGQEGAEVTAKLLDGIPGTVFTAGDNAYESGSAASFAECYAPSWGRHRARTRPAPGNHEYASPDAAPYYAYFGDNAGPPGRGYYSYDLGEWHVISLNSNVAADASSPQMEWLRGELAGRQAVCSLAYWHHPVFSSGPHGNNPKMAEIWRVLDSVGVDLVVVAHDHLYERFAPQDHVGRADPNGIRQFTVGTGGRGLYAVGAPRANSEVRDNTTLGVLKLTLRPASYDWEFVAAPGATFEDAGRAPCADVE